MNLNNNNPFNRVNLICGGTALVFSFMFWRTIKSFVGKQTSSVAVLTISNKQVKDAVYESLFEIIDKAKDDDKLQSKLELILKKTLDNWRKDPENIRILKEMLTDVLISDEFIDTSNNLIKSVITAQLNSNDNRELIINTFYDSTIIGFNMFKRRFFYFMY
jgi:uncharacterized membrane-anchored protein YjiN (DUF445 family)